MVNTLIGRKCNFRKLFPVLAVAAIAFAATTTMTAATGASAGNAINIGDSNNKAANFNANVFINAGVTNTENVAKSNNGAAIDSVKKNLEYNLGNIFNDSASAFGANTASNIATTAGYGYGAIDSRIFDDHPATTESNTLNAIIAANSRASGTGDNNATNKATMNTANTASANSRANTNTAFVMRA